MLDGDGLLGQGVAAGIDQRDAPGALVDLRGDGEVEGGDALDRGAGGLALQLVALGVLDEERDRNVAAGTDLAAGERQRPQVHDLARWYIGLSVVSRTRSGSVM